MLVRYADDLLVMCQTKQEAEDALSARSAILAELGRGLKQAETRIVLLREGGEGFDLLGFHHRYVRGNTPRSRHLTFLIRWPSRQAMQHARDRVREITARERLLLPVEDIVGTSTGPSAVGAATSAMGAPPSSSTRSPLRCEPAGDLRR